MLGKCIDAEIGQKLLLNEAYFVACIVLLWFSFPDLQGMHDTYKYQTCNLVHNKLFVLFK